jgi:hypothetical protein
MWILQLSHLGAARGVEVRVNIRMGRKPGVMSKKLETSIFNPGAFEQ